MYMLCPRVAQIGAYGWVVMVQHRLWRNEHAKEVQIAMVNLINEKFNTPFIGHLVYVHIKSQLF
jgi:hypothetical protein